MATARRRARPRRRRRSRVYVLETEPRWYERLRYPLRYEQIVVGHAENYHLDPQLVAAVIYQESKFDADAVSASGAVGLMQLLPETGQGIADRTGGNSWQPEDLTNPELNIRYGSWYLRHLLDKYDDEELALAAYNAGQTNVDRWREQGVRDPVRRDAPLRRARAGAEGDLRRTPTAPSSACPKLPGMRVAACAARLGLVVALPALAGRARAVRAHLLDERVRRSRPRLARSARWSRATSPSSAWQADGYRALGAGSPDELTAEGARRRRPERGADGDDRTALARGTPRSATTTIRPQTGAACRSRDGTHERPLPGAVADRPVREPWNRGTQFGGYFLVAGRALRPRRRRDSRARSCGALRFGAAPPRRPVSMSVIRWSRSGSGSPVTRANASAVREHAEELRDHLDRHVVPHHLAQPREALLPLRLHVLVQQLRPARGTARRYGPAAPPRTGPRASPGPRSRSPRAAPGSPARARSRRSRSDERRDDAR